MKKTILTVIQVLVTAGILFWVFHDPAKRAQMWQALSHAKPSWLLVGFLCYGIVEFLAAGRWYALLRVQGIRLPMWRVGALLMLGIFFNMFMPGGTGGDVLKIIYLMKEVPSKKKEGLLAVLMDRVIGLVALIMISSLIIGLQYNWLRTNPDARHLTWVLLLILVCSLGAIVFSFAISGFKLAHKLPARMPGRDQLIDVAVAYNAYAQAWPASLVALFASFGVHFASFFVFCSAARALGVHSGGLGAPEISFGALLTVMPIILTLSAMPVSVGGAGVREGLFAVLLGGLCGVAPGEAIMLSLTGAMLTMAWGLIGGLIYLLYRPSTQLATEPVEHVKVREAERQVHALEHEIAEREE